MRNYVKFLSCFIMVYTFISSAFAIFKNKDPVVVNVKSVNFQCSQDFTLIIYRIIFVQIQYSMTFSLL